MKCVRQENTFLVRLDRGESVTETLTAFLEDRGIEAGTVTGIGGVRDVALGYFDLEAGAYRRFEVEGNVELVLYTGNIARVEGKPFIHAHAVVSGPDFRPYAGHFFEARVAVTGEFVVRPGAGAVERRPDPFTGLNLLAFPDGAR